MSKLRFNLKTRQTSESLIILVSRDVEPKFVYSSRQKIDIKYWNDNTMRARKFGKYKKEAEQINSALDKLQQNFNETLTFFHQKNIVPTRKQLKEKLDELYLNKKSKKVTSFNQFLNQLIEERRASNKYAKATLKIYVTFRNHFKTYHPKVVSFDDLTVDFILGFKNYLLNHSNQYADNHIHKIISTLKTVLNEATDRGYNTNLAYKNKRINTPKREADNIYLNEKELDAITSLDLSQHQNLAITRDLFIIGAYSGLRFSDFSCITKDNMVCIDGVKVLKKVTQKTSDTLYIPIHPKVKVILNYYDFSPPKGFSNQKMNKHLKRICEMAQINELYEKKTFRSGRAYTEAQPKSQYVTTHTARRSFATNTYKAGVPMISIMKITGHKKTETFLKYVKISKQENALLLAKQSFFN